MILRLTSALALLLTVSCVSDFPTPQDANTPTAYNGGTADNNGSNVDDDQQSAGHAMPTNQGGIDGNSTRVDDASTSEPTTPRSAGQPNRAGRENESLQTSMGGAVGGRLTMAGQPTAGQPTAGQSTAGQPTTGQPTAGQPHAGQPTAGQPTAGQPTAGQPTAGQPTAGQHTAGQPTAGQPTAGQPTAGQPTAGQPTAGQPTAGQPTAGQHTAGQPTAGQPTGGTDDIEPPRIPEICNGLDDDGDRVVDEGFEPVNEGCSQGVGACLRTGVLRCDSQGNRQCLDEFGAPLESGIPRQEICNGIDDDCDEVIDDVVPPEDQLCTIDVAQCDAGSLFQCDVDEEQLICDLRLAEECECERVLRGPHQYWVCPTPRNRRDGEKICEFYDADIVTINGRSENDFIRDLQENNGFGSVHIGLNDLGEEGIFRWPDGQVLGQATFLNGVRGFNAVAFANFSGGQPDDFRANEDCVEMWSQPEGSWNDISCANPLPAICEARCPPGQDADGDGTFRCADDCDDGNDRLYPGAREVCFDGLDNNCDGRTDEDCPDHTCAIAQTGNQLYLICADGASRTTRNVARAFCLERGFDLVQIDTLEENDFLATQAAEVTAGDFKRFWIGLTKDNSDEFSWIGSGDALLLEPAPWAPDEPSSERPCVILYSETGHWQVIECDQRRRFICETSLIP